MSKTMGLRLKKKCGGVFAINEERCMKRILRIMNHIYSFFD